jgi:glutathione S-transferase
VTADGARPVSAGRSCRHERELERHVAAGPQVAQRRLAVARRTRPGYSPRMAPHLKLVSFDICPYVERSRIVLLEKGVPHDVEFIDLASKPAWFLAVSPMGRVPVLLVDGRPIFESMIINELIEELHPTPPMLPAEPIARAEARSWIVYANDALGPASYQAMLALAGGARGDALARPLAAVADALDRLEAQLARSGGPFFLGPAFTLVDAAYAPFLRRWTIAEGWGGPEASLLAGRPAVSAWTRTLLARPSVARAEPAELARRSRRLYEERAAKARAAS